MGKAQHMDYPEGPTRRNKRELILSSAQRLFARFGLRKTTVEEIIRSAHIAKGTFYKHFSDKESLFREIVDKESRSLVRAVRDAVSGAESSKAKMRAYLLTKAEKIHELANLHRVTQETVDEHWPMISGVREKYFLDEQKIVHEILTDGVERGELEVDAPELTAYAIVMAVKGLEMSWMVETSPMELEEGIDVLLNVLFRGVETR